MPGLWERIGRRDPQLEVELDPEAEWLVARDQRGTFSKVHVENEEGDAGDANQPVRMPN